MANNDKSKTSKTARVMNLLSKKSAAPSAEPPAGEVAAPVEAAVPAGDAPAEPRSQTPPILSSISADAAAAGQIRDALEDALRAELEPPETPAPEPVQPEPEPAPEPEPVPEPEPAPVPIPEPTPAPAPEPAPAPAPTPAPVVPEPVQAVQPPVRPVPVIPPAERLGYINVMQVLVEEKAPKYIRMFGLCDCKRCLEDVKALALNHLPPKYVVMAENEMIPKLTFYEGKYNSDITAQLLHACHKVAERPHHTRG